MVNWHLSKDTYTKLIISQELGTLSCQYKLNTDTNFREKLLGINGKLQSFQLNSNLTNTFKENNSSKMTRIVAILELWNMLKHPKY